MLLVHRSLALMTDANWQRCLLLAIGKLAIGSICVLLFYSAKPCIRVWVRAAAKTSLRDSKNVAIKKKETLQKHETGPSEKQAIL